MVATDLTIALPKDTLTQEFGDVSAQPDPNILNQVPNMQQAFNANTPSYESVQPAVNDPRYDQSQLTIHVQPNVVESAEVAGMQLQAPQPVGGIFGEFCQQVGGTVAEFTQNTRDALPQQPVQPVMTAQVNGMELDQVQQAYTPSLTPNGPFG